MRKFLLFLLIINFKVGLAQVIDGFTDGNFSKNPTWSGDNNLFEINTDKQLQTKTNTLSKSAYLSTLNNLSLNAKWEFYIKMGFDPSTSNQVRIYLTSDNANLSQPLNGYFIMIGQSGAADSYNLYKQNGTSITKIISGVAKPRAKPAELNARVLVKRNEKGDWELQTAIDGSSTYISEGKVSDVTYTTSKHFGVFCKYTATRSNKFFFDDFKISELVVDKTPPQLLNLNVVAENTIELNFDENLASTEASLASNYVLNPGNLKPSKITLNNETVFLEFANSFNTNNYTLTIRNIKDLKLNTITNPITKNFYYKKPYTAMPNDIVINEIFADPNPQVDLPTAEYIELWNVSNEDISLKDFTFTNGNTSYKFTGDSIKSKQYILLCAKADTAIFKTYGKTIGVSPFAPINNGQGKLSLYNQKSTLIYQVSYNDEWYKDDVKKSGGYSLELMDPASNCKLSQLFTASNATIGGTPGKINSNYLLNRSTIPLIATEVFIKNDSTITLNFNRGVDSLAASFSQNYVLNNGMGTPKTVILTGTFLSSVDLIFKQKIAGNKNYSITIKNISDCGSSIITTQTLQFFKPGEIQANDILVNEILFNPKPNGYDFVELYNNSDKILDLKDLFIASYNQQNSIVNLNAISDKSIIFLPKTYFVLSENPENIKLNYRVKNPSNLITLINMPSLNNDEGNVVLLNRKNEKIDYVYYSEKMHFPLLKDVEGVSLERSSFKRSGNDEGNFKSAAASVGFATPTYQNSQFLEDISTNEEVSLASETFSPDNDGFEDVMRIIYRFDKVNWVSDVTIYDKEGKLTKRLVKNQTISQNGEWQWDGFDENSNKAKTGIYLVYISLFNLEGETKQFKKVAVLASKF